jgi:hypothetical protein
MAFLSVPTSDELSVLIKTALADAQGRGVTLEDHEAALLHDQLHGALLEASNDVSGVLAPVLDRIDALNSTVAALIAESAHWREIVQRFNLSGRPSQG